MGLYKGLSMVPYADISLSNHIITSTPIVIPNTGVKIRIKAYIIP